MYCLQTHETHYFSLLRTDSVCKLNAIVCKFKCAHHIVFANQSSLQTAQLSAGTKKRLPSCARAGEGGPMEIRRRSWEIMGDTGQGGNQRIDRGDRGRSREIMRGRGRSIEVDRDLPRSREIDRDIGRSLEIGGDRSRSREIARGRRRSREIVRGRRRSLEVGGDRSRSGEIAGDPLLLGEDCRVTHVGLVCVGRLPAWDAYLICVPEGNICRLEFANRKVPYLQTTYGFANRVKQFSGLQTRA
jgi:hypothetical protein